jgi:transposase-like protein
VARSTQLSATHFVEIGSVARELGVAPSTLRSWERRYKVIVPRRGEQGQRLYDQDQIALLRRVLRLTRGGARASAAHDAIGLRRLIAAVRIQLDPTLEGPAAARSEIDKLLGSQPDPRFAFFSRLTASELVSNAVLHGSDHNPIILEASLYQDSIELAVQNAGGRLRIKNIRRRPKHGGQGLEIIDALAESWSITTGAFGTRIWVRLAADPGN